MKRLFSILVVGALLASPSAMAFWPFTKSKSKATKTEVAAKDSESKKRESTSKYEKTFIRDKSCVTTKGPFITIHQVKGKLYFEFPKKYFDRELLIASTITESSDPDLGTVGYKPNPPMHVKMTQIDTLVFMTGVNRLPNFDLSNEPLKRAMDRASLNPILNSYTVFCQSKDSSAVVIDMTALFTGNNNALSPLAKGGGGVNIRGVFNSGGSCISGVKAFEDNVVIKSYLSYTVTADLMGLILLKKDEPLTYKVTRTVLLLPEREKRMRPRLADTRVGIFNTTNTDFDGGEDYITSYSMIHRWNLQPKDTAAYLRGELVEPIKPITFYMDDAFPAEWVEGAKEGILRWNKAYEKIGFKNAIQILDYPKDDPTFDPDNLKYSCIRYVPARVANAMGPSWVDPLTGEIINASVIVYQDVVKLLNQWRFVQTAQIDERMRTKRMTPELTKESMAYILAHEVGHCLGFMHNMSASSAFPVDSLRSASFTQKYGTTASIMDYARFNYVAQPKDKGVKMTPPDLGIYDYYLVEYAYKPNFSAKTFKEEIPALDSLVDSKAGDPRFRYGRQQIFQRYDPSAIEEDLGDDPVKAAKYGVQNLKYILANLNQWITNEMDPDYSFRDMTYQNIAKQYDRYMRQVMLNIGGIYLTDVKAGTAGKRAVAVDKKRQKEALYWLVKELKNTEWMDRPEIREMLPLRVSLENIFVYYTTMELMTQYNNIMLAAHIGGPNSYTVNEYFDDLYKLIFENAIQGKPITVSDRIMQKLYIEKIIETLNKKTQLVKVTGGSTALTSEQAYAPSINEIAAFDLDESGMVNKHLDLLRDYEAINGKGAFAQEVMKNEIGSGYGWQYRLNLRTIDESKTYFHTQLLRIQSLLKSRIRSSNGDTKDHYQSMLFLISDVFKNSNAAVASVEE